MDVDVEAGARFQAPRLLFDLAELAMPPLSPASPQAVKDLSPPPVSRFALDAKDNW